MPPALAKWGGMKRCFIMFLALAALALPVDAQVFAQPRFVGPDGQKKVGDYVWVWHSETISKAAGVRSRPTVPWDTSLRAAAIVKARRWG
jgi:hypothetical protein